MLTNCVPILSYQFSVTNGCLLQSHVNFYPVSPCTCLVSTYSPVHAPGKGKSSTQALGPTPLHLFKVWSPPLLTHSGMLLQQYSFFPESSIFPSPLDLSSEYQNGMFLFLKILRIFSIPLTLPAVFSLLFF